MNSIIICEGLTDCLFIQYYMRNVYHWLDKAQGKNKIFRWCRELENKENSLLLGHNGGSSKLCSTFDNVAIGAVELKLNGHTDMTDRDDDQSE